MPRRLTAELAEPRRSFVVCDQRPCSTARYPLESSSVAYTASTRISSIPHLSETYARPPEVPTNSRIVKRAHQGYRLGRVQPGGVVYRDCRLGWQGLLVENGRWRIAVCLDWKQCNLVFSVGPWAGGFDYLWPAGWERRDAPGYLCMSSPSLQNHLLISL